MLELVLRRIIISFQKRVLTNRFSSSMPPAKPLPAAGSLPAQTQYDTGTFMDRDFVYLIADSSCNGWRYVLRVPQAQYSAYGQALTSQIVRVSIAVFLVMALVSLLVIGRLTAPFPIFWRAHKNSGKMILRAKSIAACISSPMYLMNT